MSTSTLSFFAVLKDPDGEEVRAVRKVPVTQKLQQELSVEFHTQRVAFRDSTKSIAFHPGYTPTDGERLFIDNYVLPDLFANALKEPLTQHDLTLDEETLRKIVGIFSGEWGHDRWLAAQAFDRRRLLSTKGFSLVNDHGTFKRLRDPGLTLDNKVVAIWEHQRLEFGSFNVAHRLFDLTFYFHEATDAELKAMAGNERIYVSDVDRFVGDADSWTRKKVSLIAQSGILDTQKPRAIAAVAKDYGVAILIRRVDGAEKLELPAEKKALKDVLRFLDEDYFTAVLSGKQYVTNSKRPVGPKPRRRKQGAAPQPE